MKKKSLLKKIIVITSGILLSFSLVPHSVQAIEVTKTTTLQSVHPSRIWVTEYSSKATHHQYFRRVFNGQVYKGYLGIKNGLNVRGTGLYQYSGYLYRDDFPVPTPFRKIIIQELTVSE